MRTALSTGLIALLLGLTASAQSQVPAKSATPAPLGPPLLSDAALMGDLDLDRPGLEKIKAAVTRGDFPRAKHDYLEYRRTISTARWRVMPADRPATAASTDDPAGDEVVNHVIRNMYGFAPKVGNMGADFDWTFNPIPRSNPNFSSEWTFCVISRTQFWNVLADAYWRTFNEKYAKEWVAQLEDFARKNPVENALAFSPPGGPDTLWRTLDSGIRMHDSWPYAYAHFLRSPSFTPEANWLYLNEIRTHGLRLALGLADQNRSGNWVTTECFGLYTLAVLFPELKESAAWRSSMMDRMTKEVQRAVAPDGFECELTPDYDRVTLEGFMGAVRLAKLNGQPVPGVFHDRILEMYRALVLMMRQDGKVVGTNDSSDTDVVPLARESLEFERDPMCEWAATGGKSGTAPPLATMLPYAGFYAMRGGWNTNDLFLFFRGGPTGSAHQHEDMNEIVLRVYGHTFLPDPGNYLYDHSEWRRYVINCSSHNTIIVDGKWQHRGPSLIPEAVDNPWINTPLFDFVAATYRGGYQENVYDGSKGFAPEKWVGTTDKTVSHTRRVLYLKPGCALVLDTLDGTGQHAYEAHFHLNASAAHLDPSTQSVYASVQNGPLLALFPLDRDGLEAQIVTGQKSPMLGWSNETRQPAPTLCYRKTQPAPAVFSTLLLPTTGAVPSLTAEGLGLPEVLWGRELKTEREEMEIAVAKDGVSKPISFRSSRAGAVAARAAGLVLRHPAQGTGDFVGGWGLGAYEDTVLKFALAMPGNIVVSRDGNRLFMFAATADAQRVALTRPFVKNFVLPPGTWEQISSDRDPFPATPDLAALAPATTGVKPARQP